jgi:hypothetical protein
MVGIGRSKPFGVALVFAGAIAVITYLIGCVLPRTLPSADGSSTQGSQMFDASIVQEKQTPLDCRIAQFGAAERKMEMEKSSWFRSMLDQAKFRGRPGVATPRMFRNPLIADDSWIKVEIENTSGGDFTFRTYKDAVPYFLIETSVQDSAGKPLVYSPEMEGIANLARWPFSGESLGVTTWAEIAGAASLPRRPVTFPEYYPLKTMKAGQVETFSPSFIRSGPDYCNIKPGKYSMRATYLYWTPDGTERRVQSQPFAVTLTAEDIREWEEFWH